MSVNFDPPRRTTPVDETSGNIVAFIKALRKHWPIVAASTLLATVISLVYSKSLPKVYEAQTTVEFDPDAIRPLADKTDPMRGFTSFWGNQEFYETQYKIITSDRVLAAVVREQSLQTDPAFAGVRTSPMALDEAVSSLRARVRVEPLKGSRLVYIRLEDQNPKFAQKLCNALAEAYISQNLDKTVSATSDAVVWLNGQLDHYKGELESSENLLHEFKKSNDLPSSSIDEVSKMIRLEMQEYDEALTHTRTHKQELLARYDELSKVSSNDPDLIPASELLSNVYLSTLRSAYQVAVRERRELVAEGKAENHPLVKKADGKTDEVKKALLDEIENIKGAVQRDLAIIGRQEAGEAALYEGARRRAVDLNLKELEYHRMDRVRAQNEKLYGALLEQSKEADLARMMNVNNIRLVDAATEPKVPVRPHVPANVGIGFLLGFVLGIGLVLTREQLDNSLKTPIDVEQRLGVTFLGLLPEVNDDEELKRSSNGKSKRRRLVAPQLPPELVVHERPLSGVAEAARTLRTNLMFMNPDKPHRRLLVTSAAPAEGKTTVACSIAISMAQGGQRVCIVDCDLRRPRLHRIFDRVGDMGLTNVLVGETTVDDVARPTIIENLWCVPAGPTPPNPADVLHSERFRQLLKDLSDRFDRVILDSPPLVAVTDSAIISTLVDGTVFVVRAFSTTRALSRQGLRALIDIDARVLGAVLNAVDLKKHEYDYYQYYYYKREGYRPIAQPTKLDDDNQGAAAPPN